jgi:outer membrane receptor protein involved in Fe transport
MKMIVFGLLCCLFVLFVSQIDLLSQEIQQPAATAAETAKNPEIKEGPKKKTEAFTLGEIVVKTKRIANIENSTTTTIVTSEDIEAHGDISLNDSLKLIPGFITFQHAKGHKRFYLRGFEMPYVSLLIDGIPIADVYEANVDISKIPVMNASEIVINRGTSSALYGAMGTVGSINVISKKPADLYAKGNAEYGINGEYTLNAVHGMAINNFYYWLTANVAKEAPFEVSKKLDRSERLKWFNKLYPSLGYTIDTSPASVYALDKYLNDTGKWPHQEMMKYNISAKSGYAFFKGFESGITLNYSLSESKRYSNSLTNTEETTNGAWSNSAQSNTLKFGATAFNWRDVYSITAAPYINYENGDFSVKGNIFFIFNNEVLDGYIDADETTPVTSWGGDHSNWQNTSAGLNVLPSYKLANWNKLNSSLLFRWDKHLEREQADSRFVGTGLGSADAAYALSGNGYFNTKSMKMEQLTVALEDEINFNTVIEVPLSLSAGISYDAQKFSEYKRRNSTRTAGRVTYFYPTMEDQYIAKKDSAIWGTRDSFNPVAGLTYEPLKDFLMLRASFSQKTRLPMMSQYANVASEVTDDGLKPEKSYNTNAGFEFFFLKKSLSVRTDYFYSKFKDKLATIYDPSKPSFKAYTNTKGETHQGIEFITSGKYKNLIDRIMDVNVSLSYTYLKIMNLENSANSATNKGDIPTSTNGTTSVPEHQVVADIRLDFFTKTSLNIFGEYMANSVRYAMKSNPVAANSFSTDYYKKVNLHNPLMFNVKISQKIFDKYEAYILCRNIFDDYDIDPFNPGPGRQFFFGASAEL